MSLEELVTGDFNSCATADALPISSMIIFILFLKLRKNKIKITIHTLIKHLAFFVIHSTKHSSIKNSLIVKF